MSDPRWRRFVGSCREILGEEAAAERALAALQGLQVGSLVVGASTTIGSYLIPQIMGRFHTAHPEIDLSLEIANSATVQDKVLEGSFDLGFIEGAAPGRPPLWCRRLFTTMKWW